MREAFLASSDEGAYTPEELKIREGGFQAAYQLQQKTIDALMQNIESMSQTNGALSNRLAYYNDRNAELNANNRDLQTKLDKAVTIVEDYLDELEQSDNKYCQEKADEIRQTLAEIKENIE